MWPPPRRRKILRDLWLNKSRTLLVVLSIAIGVFAVGMVLGTRIVLTSTLSDSYAAIRPAHLVLYVDGIEEDLLGVLARDPQVRALEGRRALQLRMLDGDGSWRTVSVDLLADFEAQQINRVTPVSGAWPPPARSALVERSALPLLESGVGQSITVETDAGRRRELLVSGVAYDANKLPAPFIGEPYLYITPETARWLGFTTLFNQIHVETTLDPTETGAVQAVADRLGARIERAGGTLLWSWLPTPGEHPLNDIIAPVMVILGALGVLSLLSSTFLVINIINSVLARETRQIGMMKAVGARSGELVRLYLFMVLIFGALALLLAWPAGHLGTLALTRYATTLLNVDLVSFTFPPEIILLEAGVALVVPVLAALVPVIRGARVTVRAALTDYGLGDAAFGRHVVDRLVESMTGGLPFVNRPMRIGLRNTVRRKGRLLLTLSMLTLGGAIFIAVLSVHASFEATMDRALDYFAYDVDVTFARPQRIAEAARVAEGVPGVVEADGWLTVTGRRVRESGREGPNVTLLGVRPDTGMIAPTVLEGRWLLPGDGNGIVLNTQFLQEEPGIAVGDTVVLKLEGEETAWQVVGVVQGVLTGPLVYAPREYTGRLLHTVGQSATLQVVADDHSPPGQRELARRLTAALGGSGMRVATTQTTAEVQEAVTYQSNIIVLFLIIMAVLIALVGGLGLMGTMSVNVMERTREIGVMRAVGATNGAVMNIVLIEAIFVGFISWLLSALCAYPLARLLSDMVGVAFLDSPLAFEYSAGGALLWLGGVLVIAALAALLPARHAARLTVRQTLAYE